MPRRFSQGFKEAAVRRMLAGEKVQALARELELKSDPASCPPGLMAIPATGVRVQRDFAMLLY
jgi:hypothetical protein